MEETKKQSWWPLIFTLITLGTAVVNLGLICINLMRGTPSNTPLCVEPEESSFTIELQTASGERYQAPARVFYTAICLSSGIEYEPRMDLRIEAGLLRVPIVCDDRRVVISLIRVEPENPLCGPTEARRPMTSPLPAGATIAYRVQCRLP